MSGFTLTKKINASVDAVFDVFTDFEKARERVSGITKMEMLTEPPVGAGTRFRETRIMFKKEHAEEMEITSFDPGKHYTVRCESCGCVYESEFKFRPDGSSTEVEVEMRTRAVSFFAKLMSPLGKLMMGPMKKCIDKDMEELKSAAENRSEVEVPS